MDRWRIRTGTEDDAVAVLKLWMDAEGTPSATDNPEGLRRLLSQDPGSLLLAEESGEVVGSLIAAWDGWRGSFYRLAVDPARRRRGVATALVHAGERRLRNLGAVRLTAIAVSTEPGATGLWRALGYEQQSDRNRFVRMAP
jgi:ribosomal protein S18 acetylase RimI-like enzyme